MPTWIDGEKIDDIAQKIKDMIASCKSNELSILLRDACCKEEKSVNINMSLEIIDNQIKTDAANNNYEGCKTQSGNEIKSLCDEFMNSIGYAATTSYRITEKLRKGLSIPEDETIYLGYDFSLFKNGKNGFAITSRGLYCRTMLTPAFMITYEEYAKVSNIKWNDGESNVSILADGNPVTYGAVNVDEQLLKLYRDIQIVCREKYLCNNSCKEGD